MTFTEFENTLKLAAPDDSWSPLLQALWWDAKGDWEAAHEIAQSKEGTKAFDRLHAYLHRVEGDDWNARYWYRRAGATLPDQTLREEWEYLVREHL
ncbi:hypothetical protein [Arundinibacter roseus]|uniref:Tetratricopeptide repeat protein n=1 Tax=Arundinibacter roseus TaxID=2070510 RepID=A0A4R4KBD7_9BACT|nr:hypothetical protein [Arundinibacter roseus]TDB65068.1 hypothetical protein EZE20_10135 [Arundinibacter roseus]